MNPSASAPRRLVALSPLLAAVASLAACGNVAERSPPAASDGSPCATISGGGVTVHIALPDAERGFYRGKRFDASGMIRRVEYAGHVFFTPWKTPRDPLGHDDNSSGPCEEFGMHGPLGYSECRPGERFIKIGVGVLERIDEKDYSFDGAYPIARRGEWSVDRAPDRIRFEQRLSDGRGYGYRYAKVLRLEADRPVLWIEHELENTGRRLIDTDFYNHNFTSIDEETVGPDHRLSFGPKASARRSLPEFAEIRQGVLSFSGEVTEPFFTEIDDLSATDVDGRFTIENTRSGAGVRIRGDRAPYMVNLYVAPLAICPEAFLRLEVKPGETLRWKIRYELFAAK